MVGGQFESVGWLEGSLRVLNLAEMAAAPALLLTPSPDRACLGMWR